MAFRTNSSQQLSLTDITNSLTSREQKALENSWAKIFAEDIFPSIEEERFRVIYSDRAQSKFNTPVNICIGALIIKEMFQISDDEVVENLMLDPRYQYALHTTSSPEQPLSDKTLSRFRKRCYDYERETGVDLHHGCVTDLSGKIAKMMKVNPRIRRMDSMMIEANIKNLSRAELLYSCVAKLARCLHKAERNDLLEGLEHYYDPNDFNRTFYYNDSTETEDITRTVLEDADRLLVLGRDNFSGMDDYQLLERCLSEQTIAEGGVRRLREKKKDPFPKAMMQSPTDPEATYREKAGKKYRGYVANLEEAVDRNGSVIIDYQFDQNIHSDSQFLKDRLESMERQEEKTILATDGAYCGESNSISAQEKNIQLVTTALTGIEVPDIYADFELSADGKQVLRCPMGYIPKSSCYTEGGGGHIYVSYPKDVCMSCPHREECRVKEHKQVCSFTISATAQYRAKAKRFMSTEEFKLLSRIRNGIETVPSVLRKKHHADRMPVHGTRRNRFFFGCKVAAINVRKLFDYRKGKGHYAQNPLFAG